MEKTIRNFTDPYVWQEGHKLVLMVYKIVEGFPRKEVYRLTSQICRAVVSVTSNIAEGFSRYHFKDKNNFYYDSRGSLSEVYNQLLIAKGLDYLSPEQLNVLIEQIDRVAALLNGLINSTKQRVK